MLQNDTENKALIGQLLEDSVLKIFSEAERARKRGKGKARREVKGTRDEDDDDDDGGDERVELNEPVDAKVNVPDDLFPY